MSRYFRIILFFLMLFPLTAMAEEHLQITEVMASNGTWTSGHAYDWVEIYNAGSSRVELSGWHLSDSKKHPDKFEFPEGAFIGSGEYILVYCTGSETENSAKDPYYAPFKISASKDQVYLFSPDSAIHDSISFEDQYGNISYGISTSGETGYFETATPGKKNGSTVFQRRTPAPSFLSAGGFVEKGTLITASAQTGSLHYTTDGSTPSASSPLFPEEGFSVKKTTVLRIRAFEDNAVPSATVSLTCFAGEDLPVAVVSLITDESYLFGKKAGALVKGTGSIPNYDKELEYPINIEYFDADGTCIINQMGSFTASGHSARRNAQKSIAIYARKAYGPEYFSFNPFPHRDYTRYKSLLLRSTNSDAYSERLRDVVFSSLAEPLDLCYQDAVPIVVFINGEYWGHYNLREKINKYMVAQWENIDLDDEDTVDAIDILQRTGSDRFVQNGSNEDWLELCSFCKTEDLNVPENLAWVTDRLDVDNLFTHASYEIISGNSDITNVRMYRVPGGKWKYLLFDVEASFGSGSDSATVPLENYIKKVSAKIQAFRHEPLNALLAVPEMKDRFLKTFAHVLESCFLWPYVDEHFAPWEAVLEDLLPRHNQRWPYLTMERWRKNVNATKYYARVRPKKIIPMLKKRMKLTDAEVEQYFGELIRTLEVTNAKP